MTEPVLPLTDRIEANADNVERELLKLVLTIVELVRQFMERQAIRRMEEGDLSTAQVEELGRGLMRLDDAMTALREQFGLSASDLNIDLGPLGSLLPE